MEQRDTLVPEPRMEGKAEACMRQECMEKAHDVVGKVPGNRTKEATAHF